MVSTLGSFGIVGVGLIGSEFGVTFCETYFVKSDMDHTFIVLTAYCPRTHAAAAGIIRNR